MPELRFAVEKAEPLPFAAAPHLLFHLQVSERDATPIHSIMLRCQIRIEPARRSYARPEQDRLLDLFGGPERYGQTLRSLLWTHASVVVPPFTGSTTVEMPVPCTFDFNVAATKYFYALEAGEVPLCLLFSGTIFQASEAGSLQVAQVPWNSETAYRLPVQVWRSMMELYYPNTAWLCLRQDVFDRLYQYKTQQGMPDWEQTLDHLLGNAKEGHATRVD